MVVDHNGYRLNVGIILCNRDGQVFWGRRLGHSAWQFPQGGVDPKESAYYAMQRELTEELGLNFKDVTVLGSTKNWIKYQLPEKYIRHNSNPLVIGQKQKWFLLALNNSEQKIQLDYTDHPEFDSWRWVDYWFPVNEVIYFKRRVYQQALKELERFLT